MGKILISIFLQSFPETLLLLSVGLVLIGYEIKQNLKIIALVALLFSILSQVINSFPILVGLNTLIQIPILIFLVIKLLKQKLPSAILIVLMGTTCLALFETINMAIVTQMFHISTDKIFKNLLLNTLIPYIHYTLIFLFVVFLKIKDITILPLLYKIKSKKYNAGFITTVIILILSLSAIILYLTLFVIRKKPFNLEELEILNILLFLFLVSIAVIIKKVVSLTENQAVAETQELYLKNLNELHTSFRALRHDFSNQVQILSALINSNEIEEAKNYINSLGQNVNVLTKAIKVNNPVITALLQTKTAQAEINNIDFTIDIRNSLDNLPLTDLELTRILGNLLDNAFEATNTLPVEQKKVSLTINSDNNIYIIKVTNTGEDIPNHVLQNIFNSGITTKNNHSGLGLTIVKKIIKKYKGDVGIKSDNDETEFTVVIPFGRKKS